MEQVKNFGARCPGGAGVHFTTLCGDDDDDDRSAVQLRRSLEEAVSSSLDEESKEEEGDSDSTISYCEERWVEALIDRLRSLPLSKRSQLDELELSNSEVMLAMIQNISGFLRRLISPGADSSCERIDSSLMKDGEEVWRIHRILVVDAVERQLFSTNVNYDMISYLEGVRDSFGFEPFIGGEPERERL
jgi:hypothetical protein